MYIKLVVSSSVLMYERRRMMYIEIISLELKDEEKRRSSDYDGQQGG